MADFLLELRCEEIPARMQAGARAELEKLFRRELEAAGVAVGTLSVWSTPRRLALIARGLPLATEAVSEEAKGPPEGAPDAAIDGFCKKAGVTRDQLELRDVKGRMTYFAVVNIPGRPMAEVLAAAIPAIIRDFSWPKSMRWGAASITTDSLRWVRPLSGIVALLDGAVVECEVGGIAAGRTTFGHRFHASGPVTIDSADDYIAKLREAFVIVNHEERQDIIREGAAAAAAAEGLTLIADEGLVIENAGLTEWPVPLLGRFDEAYLDVPPEVIQLTARVNQKYFVCEGEGGKLANAFVCTANIEPNDPAVVVDGNRKVLAARLSDARFFWEQDQKTPLAVHAEKLSRITFHEKLGTVAARCDRVGRLLGQMLAPSFEALENFVEPSVGLAHLAKADLVTEMVGEFPELQGTMGAYYIAQEGAPVSIVEAISGQYSPRGQSDGVPVGETAYLLALADKIEMLTSFFAIDERPTGSKDPFALRRASLGIIRIVVERKLRTNIHRWIYLSLNNLVMQAMDNIIGYYEHDLQGVHDASSELTFDTDAMRINYKGLVLEVPPSLKPSLLIASNFEDVDRQGRLTEEIFEFLIDRLKVQQREAGVPHDLIDAVFALGGEDDLVRLLARVHALQAFVTTEDGTNLLAGYKRAANILKKEGFTGAAAQPDPQVLASLKADNEGIPDTGEEDPLALVDDPDVGDILAAEARGNAALSYTPEEAEKALIDALDAAAPRAAAAVEGERFADAMAALATLRAPIDRFFEEVTVNDPQADKRAARLALLARFRDAVHRVADFSRIEG
ncbi:glycine--tRNA ligase subunit beta [Erythrobacter colymbi]|uniref:glycine--tRNA ligase subunit beta n=1 Tax=Erythrobacter colymbi TaxID=1161202 RepID=UPI000A37216F|nr:glycine--tRNA ligase subunit beta [Erythrobacter colymbi]